MFALAQSPIYTQQPSQRAGASYYEPGLEVAPTSRTEYLTGQDDATVQRDLLHRFDCENDDEAIFQAPGRILYSKQSGSKVTIKKVLRSSLQEASDVDREITIRCAARDASILLLIESLELKDVIWTVTEYRPMHTMAEMIRSNGPMSEPVLKTALNQLFGGVVSIFAAGFAHLRICDKTVCLDENRQIVITGLEFACEYGKEKTNQLYALTSEKHGDDIYVAPEVFSSLEYNARKASIWSCGVLIYFMATGQTAKLSILGHPSFDNPFPDTSESLSQSSRPRRATVAGLPTHHNKLENASIQSKFILSLARFDVPNYVRSVVPKMLAEEPEHRAELIEIASRVPKDYESKDPRPLMEMAWHDYKTHVGPMAGLDLGDSGSIRGRGSASSIYSMASAMSNPFRSLLGKGQSKRHSVSAEYGRSGW